MNTVAGEKRVHIHILKWILQIYSVSQANNTSVVTLPMDVGQALQEDNGFVNVFSLALYSFQF